MSIRLTVAAALAALALAPAAAAADGPLPPGSCETHGAAGLAYETGVNCRFVEVDDHPRRYVVYVPDRRLPEAPVVFMFHGSSGTGEQFLRISGWREQADRTGLVAVFPTALQYRVLESGFRVTKWNEFGLRAKIDPHELPPGYPEDAPMPADDTGFVDAMLADLDSRLPIDRHRIYMSGFSNGAGFAARLSVERSTRVAAAAYSAGGLSGAKSRTAPCRPTSRPARSTTGSSPGPASPSFPSIRSRSSRNRCSARSSTPTSPPWDWTAAISAPPPARRRRCCAGPRPTRCSSSG